ncbi:hypothetical protein SAMN05444414_11631 [Roseovarius marisflavi]|uniref:Uncharacterized protein n=1 Tax=Roseovarius marisflavi TaxID=1054996 RepID=A0A1M7B2W8_9RHOB|nr:hypothetical protein [Roseovarius marisflavi]SHL49345.1 hypothetical protein SAMN05444414_11631 [Roseovarius marisflavi]
MSSGLTVSLAPHVCNDGCLAAFMEALDAEGEITFSEGEAEGRTLSFAEEAREIEQSMEIDNG